MGLIIFVCFIDSEKPFDRIKLLNCWNIEEPLIFDSCLHINARNRNNYKKKLYKLDRE